ncbi:MAG: TIR domain-containing protein [Gemmatimonadetes bacterium]|nr:TIR domain-containing protein [Gemmatimonadota bacterium]
MADVFISYAREDLAYATVVANQLTAQGWSVWWDRRLSAGTLFHDEIERELDSARCVVVIWTPVSVAKDWVKVEAEEGRQRGILVPVRIGICRVPLSFRGVQTAHCDDWATERLRETCLKEVVDGVAAKVGVKSPETAYTGDVGAAVGEAIASGDSSQAHPEPTAGIVDGHDLAAHQAEVANDDALKSGTVRARPIPSSSPPVFPRLWDSLLVVGLALIASLGLWIVFRRGSSPAPESFAKGDGAFIWNEDGRLLGKPIGNGRVVDASFSPSGETIATISTDSTVKLWDGQTLAPIGVTMRHDDIPRT